MANEENFPLTEFERELKDMETTLTEAEIYFEADQDMVEVIQQTKEGVVWIRERSLWYLPQQKENLNTWLKQKQQQRGY